MFRRTTKFKFIILVCVFATSIGIAFITFTILHKSGQYGEQIYFGEYTSGPETSSFTPFENPSKENWWVEFAPELKDHPAKALLRSGTGHPAQSRFELRAKGRLTKRGNYGHLGQYEREFFITTIISARSLTVHSTRTLPPLANFPSDLSDSPPPTAAPPSAAPVTAER